MFGVIWALVLVSSVLVQAGESLEVTPSARLSAAIEEDNVEGIVALCQGKSYTENDMINVVKWALDHEESGGVNVAQAIVKGPNGSEGLIRYSISKAIKANKREILKILVQSKNASDKSLCKVLRWVIEMEDTTDCDATTLVAAAEGGFFDESDIIPTVIANPNLTSDSINRRLLDAIETDKRECIKFLAAASIHDGGVLLAALNWSVGHLDSDHGSMVAQIVVQNPAVEANSINLAFYNAIGTGNADIIKILATSNKVSSEKLYKALMWAIANKGNEDALEIVRIAIESEHMSPQSIYYGFYNAIRNGNLEAIMILAESRWASSYSLGDALSFVIKHPTSDRGDIATVIANNINTHPYPLRAGLALSIELGKHEIAKALINSGKLEDSELEYAIELAEVKGFDDIVALCQARLNSLPSIATTF